jgi:hypothetical protein
MKNSPGRRSLGKWTQPRIRASPSIIQHKAAGMVLKNARACCDPRKAPYMESPVNRIIMANVSQSRIRLNLYILIYPNNHGFRYGLSCFILGRESIIKCPGLMPALAGITLYPDK